MLLILLACRSSPSSDRSDSTDPSPSLPAESHSATPPHTGGSARAHSAEHSGGPTCWDDVLASGYLSVAPDGRGDDVDTTCGAEGADDWVVRYVAPSAGRYVVSMADVSSFAPVPCTLQVLDGCGGAALGCAVDTFTGQPTFVLDLDREESVVLVVEAPHPYAPNYLAEVPVRVAPLQAAEVGCLDGFDDDADGRVDCADADCAAEPRCDCVDGELVPGTLLRGTTVGGLSSRRTACSYYSGNDRSYRFVAPAAGRWAFEATSPSRAVVSVSDRCDGPEYACDSHGGGLTGGLVELDLAAGEAVIVTVELLYGDDGFALQVSPR